jgi:hypothetical protein
MRLFLMGAVGINALVCEAMSGRTEHAIHKGWARELDSSDFFDFMGLKLMYSPHQKSLLDRWVDGPES